MKLLYTLFGGAFVFAGAVTTLEAQAQSVLRADAAAPGRLDPSRVSDYASSILSFNVYDTLVEPAPGDAVIAPALAESWEVSEDNLSVTFDLRDDVEFHAGGTLTSEDVVFSLDRLLALNSGYARLFQGVTAEATGEHAVVFTLPEPNATFLPSLVRLPIVQKSTVMENLADGDYGEMGDYGEAFLAERGAGSGAYVVTSHNPQEETVLTRFDGHFREFAPNAPDEVRIRYSVEPATIRTLMAQGEWEITSQWLPMEVKRALAGMGGMSVVMEEGFSYFIMPLNAQLAPTDDVHFRRAMALAIDYEAMLELLQVGDARTATQMPGTIPSGMLGHDPTLPVLTQDLEAAREELAMSRYADNPPPVEMIWVSEVAVEEQIGLIVQQSLAEIGIQVNLTRVPWTLLTQQVAQVESTPNVTQRFVQAPFPDPDSLISQNNHSRYMGTTLKMDWHEDEEVDELLDRARAEQDLEERKALYKEIQTRVMDSMPTIYAFQTSDSFVKQNYVDVPGFENTENTVAVQGGNWTFRTFSVNKEE